MIAILSRTVAFGLTAVLILLVAAGIGGASITGSTVTPADGGAASASAAHELVTAGGAPRYIPTASSAMAWQPQPGSTGLAELRWGEGGPPVLVPVEAVR